MVCGAGADYDDDVFVVVADWVKWYIWFKHDFIINHEKSNDLN